MDNKYRFQVIYAEATSIPYDATAIARCKTALHELANWYGVGGAWKDSRKKAKKGYVKALKALRAQPELDQAISTMGTVATFVGQLASHVHAPLEDSNLPQIQYDIYSFLHVLEVLQMLHEGK